MALSPTKNRTFRDLQETTFKSYVLNKQEYYGEAFIKKNDALEGIRSLVDTESWDIFTAGCLFVRSTRATNMALSSSGEESVIVLDNRWLDYYLGFNRLNTLYTDTVIDTGEIIDKNTLSLSRGLISIIAIEVLIDTEFSGSIPFLLRRNVDYIKEYVEFCKSYDSTGNTLTAGDQTLWIFGSRLVMWHEISHFLMDFAFKHKKDDLLDSVQHLLETLENEKLRNSNNRQIEFSVTQSDIVTLKFDEEEALKYCLDANRSTTDELVADYRMLEHFLEFTPLFKHPAFSHIFNSKYGYLGWIGIQANRHVQAITAISEIKYLSRHVIGAGKTHTSRFYGFVAELTARKRLTFLGALSILENKNSEITANSTVKNEVFDHIINGSNNSHFVYSQMLEQGKVAVFGKGDFGTSRKSLSDKEKMEVLEQTGFYSGMGV